jgi:HAD superfamily hydrolase (TIGR01509 family)
VFIIEKCFSDDSDIFHFYNPHNKYSKFDMCNKIQSIIQNKGVVIEPNNAKSYGIAVRPYDTDLCDNKYDIQKYRFTDFDKTLDLCFNKYKLSNINNDSFFMIDLDGTLINSSKVHYEAYERVFQKMDKPFIDFDKWNSIINSKHFDDYMKDEMNFNVQEVDTIKQDKLVEFQNTENIEIIENADIFINKLNEMKINYCVVTNTGKKTIEIFKEKQPMLKLIDKWIVREDYQEPKPNSECFELAIKKYGKNAKNVIGIEDSEVGFKALKDVTSLIFMVNNDNIFKNNDCYIFNDYVQLLNLL